MRRGLRARAIALALAIAGGRAHATSKCASYSDDYQKNTGFGTVRLDVHKYEAWCECCGGTPVRNRGTTTHGCDQGPNWGRTACAGYDGDAANAAGEKSFLEIASKYASRSSNPQQAMEMYMLGGFLDASRAFGKSLAGDAARRQRLAQEALRRREDEQRREQEELARRNEQILSSLRGKIKTEREDGSGARYDNDRRQVGGLTVKTERDLFGTRRQAFGRSSAEDRDAGEGDKKESDKVANRLARRPAPLEEAHREARVRLQLAEQDVAEIGKLLAEKRAALERKRAEARKKAPAPEPAAPAAPPAQPTQQPETPAKKQSDAEAAAERLLREADQNEIEAIEKALEKAVQEKSEAAQRLEDASKKLEGGAPGRPRP